MGGGTSYGVVTSPAASPRPLIKGLAWDIGLNATIPLACYYVSKRFVSPSELTALEALGVGIQAKFDAFEVYAELARRVPASFLQEKIKLLAKEKRIWRY